MEIIEKTITDNPEVILLMANKEIEQRNINEALILLENSIQQYPEYGPTYNYLGWISSNSFNDFSQACSYYELAIRYSPEYPSTYVNFANILNTLGEFERLEELLNEALKIPGAIKPRLYHEEGIMYELQGNYSSAISSYQKAIKYCLITREVERYQTAIYRCQLKSECF